MNIDPNKKNLAAGAALGAGAALAYKGLGNQPHRIIRNVNISVKGIPEKIQDSSIAKKALNTVRNIKSNVSDNTESKFGPIGKRIIGHINNIKNNVSADSVSHAVKGGHVVTNQLSKAVNTLSDF